MSAASVHPPHGANAFNLLRSVLALGVLYSHTYFLGPYGEEPFSVFIKSQSSGGTLAVLGFFGLSGYLVTASYERSDGVWSYLTKRVRRIIPGLWVCLFVTAFALAPAIAFLRQGTLGEFPWIHGDNSALGFFVSNLAIRIQQWSIADILHGAQYDGSLNGSLWSLWPEAICYVLVAILGLTGALGRNRLLLVVGTLALFLFHAARILNPSLPIPTQPTWVALTSFPPYFVAYFVGMLLWVYRDYYVPDRPALVLVLVALACLGRLGGLQLLAPVLVPLALVLFGLCFQWHLSHDVSYGLYIYGFQVQQLFAATALTQFPWWVFFIISSACTLAFALLSWHCVERPFLRHRAGPA